MTEHKLSGNQSFSFVTYAIRPSTHWLVIPAFGKFLLVLSRTFGPLRNLSRLFCFVKFPNIIVVNLFFILQALLRGAVSQQSAVILVCMAIDRYLYLLHPDTYHKHSSKKVSSFIACLNNVSFLTFPFL